MHRVWRALRILVGICIVGQEDSKLTETGWEQGVMKEEQGMQIKSVKKSLMEVNDKA